MAHNTDLIHREPEGRFITSNNTGIYLYICAVRDDLTWNPRGEYITRNEDD